MTESYWSKAQYTAEKPIHQQPTNPPCVHNATTAVQQMPERGRYSGQKKKYAELCQSEANITTALT